MKAILKARLMFSKDIVVLSIIIPYEFWLIPEQFILEYCEEKSLILKSVSYEVK